MFKILRIICCIISALCVAGCIFVFIYAGTVWGICVLLGAVVFFALTVLFKRYQNDDEEKRKTIAKENEENQPEDIID
ncbi:MAG: hypothetical protein ACI4MS_01130 [Candidatus Coproplasma sp.]